MQSMTAVTFTKLCNHRHYLTLEHFIISVRNSMSIKQWLHVTPFLQLLPSLPCFLSLCFAFLGLSYKWNYAICMASFVLLLSLCMMFQRLIHVVESISTLLLFIQESDSIAWIHPIYLCIHPPMDTKVVSIWGYCEQRCHEHSCKSFCLNHSAFRCSF